MVAKQQTSDGLCYEAFWVRQWSKALIDAGPGASLVANGTIEASVDSLDSQFHVNYEPHPELRGLGGGHSSGMAVELAFVVCAQN